MKAQDYFRLDQKNDCVFFMGDDLRCYIPRRYEDKHLLIIEQKISTFGIFTMEINPESNNKIVCGFQLPSIITMEPDETYSATYNNEPHFVCKLRKGNKFMTTLTILQDNKLPYQMYLEYLSLGNMPAYINYKNVVGLMDDLDIANVSLPADHVMWEIIYAHIYRDANNISMPYRHTTMKEPPIQVTIRDVAHGASNTQARILGAFADDGRNVALINQADQNNELEDFFRM